VAAFTSDGLTAAALTSISTSFAARDSVRRSTDSASEAGLSAFAGSLTQRASTATGGPSGCLGAVIIGVPGFPGDFERELTRDR
jgi:hypothetical protein